MIYALALLPTFAAVGAAIDMGQAVVVRTRLSEALDAAGLAVGSTPGLSAAEIQQRAQQFFDANYPAEKLGTPATITAVQNGHVVQLSASANVTTAFMGLLGISELEVATTSEIVRENRGLEVVLSLDNTGSMANSGKIQALKTSMTELINI
ncbi:MAG TPA: pilus assembly protein TadG, partial [Alphaproteobacteria bacterium]|nr:pilus assembly protein TadG [Alphaproteobacteria bacterium]